jgi:hypothetical protein
LLILLQLISSVIHFSLNKSLHRQWVQVSLLEYFLVLLFCRSMSSLMMTIFIG